MTYSAAKKLHNGNEVLRKSDGCPLYVTNTEHHTDKKTILIFCNDGECYHHKDIK